MDVGLGDAALEQAVVDEVHPAAGATDVRLVALELGDERGEARVDDRVGPVEVATDWDRWPSSVAWTVVPDISAVRRNARASGSAVISSRCSGAMALASRRSR